MLLVSAKKDKEIIYYNRQNDSVYIIPFNQTPTIYFKKPYVLVVEILCLINAIIGVFSNFAVFLTFNIISAIFVVLLVCNYERRQSLELLKIIEGNEVKVNSMEIGEINWLRERMLLVDFFPNSYFTGRRKGFAALGPFIPIITSILAPAQIYEGIIISIVLTELLIFLLWISGDFGRYIFKRKISKLRNEVLRNTSTEPHVHDLPRRKDC